MKRCTYRTRRAVLATTTSAAIVGIAGCLGATEDPDEGDPDEEDTDEAEDELDQAADYIEENGDLLDEFEEATSVTTSEDTPEFDYTTFERNIDRARVHLENAEDAAPETYGDAIKFYHTVLDYQVEIGKCNALIEDYLLCLETMDALIAADRWEDAADQHKDCVETLRDVESQLDASVNALNEIDTIDLSEPEQLGYDATEEDLTVTQAELPALFDFHEGMQSFLEGMTEMLDAMEAFEDEETGAAKRGFSRAEGHFADAESVYEQLETDPELPDDLKPDVIEMHCFMSAFEEAAGHWYNAVEAYENRNESRYNNELDAADAALERCE